MTDAATVLARTSEGAKAGPIGFAVILVLCVACYFLFKSMSKHLRTVRENFPDQPGSRPAGSEAAKPAESGVAKPDVAAGEQLPRVTAEPVQRSADQPPP